MDWLSLSVVPGGSGERGGGLTEAEAGAVADAVSVARWAEWWFAPLAIDAMPHGVGFFGYAMQGRDGCWVKSANKSAPGLVCVDLPGEVVHHPLIRIRRALRALGEWRCTRLDVAWDGSRVGPELVRRHWAAGEVSTSTAVWKWYDNDQGQTFYLGGRASGWMLCIYNRRGFNRVELRVYGAKAEFLAGELVTRSAVDFEAGCRGVLAGCATVHDQAWRELISGASRRRFPVVPSRGPSRDALERSVAGLGTRLAAYVELFGMPALERVIDSGRKRMTRRYRSVYGLPANDLPKIGY